MRLFICLTNTILVVVLATSPCLGQQDNPFGQRPVNSTTSVKKSPHQDLSSVSQQNDEIRQLLNQRLTLDYDEAPWSEIEEDLERRLKINIVLSPSAQDDSLTQDEPLTVNLSNVAGKNALRIMLADKNSTYTVKGGVLVILSLDDCEDVQWFSNHFINVRPLLAKITELERARIGKPKVTTRVLSKSVVPVVGQAGVVEATANQQTGSKPGAISPDDLISAESLLIGTIQSSFYPDSWNETGQGLATIEVLGGCLIVGCQDQMADELEDFLKDLTFRMSQN